MKEIKRAILSVSDKENLVNLAQNLLDFGIEIYSTGGTLKKLQEAEIPAKSIENYTLFPEILDGRVKTLHPKIHAGILAKRDSKKHQKNLEEHNISSFDLVCVNLYPFEKVIQKEKASLEEVIENIDIGGPSMIRAAAKNYKDVVVITNVDQYEKLTQKLKENQGRTSLEDRFQFAIQAFQRSASYDSIISNYLNTLTENYLPQIQNLTIKKSQELRYGENPHQKAAFYIPTLKNSLPWKKLHGKDLSYNNLLDLDAALQLSRDFEEPLCAIFKHSNPCGVSIGREQKENLLKAMSTDPISFFGGIVLFNEVLMTDVAYELNKHFFEIIIAEKFDKKAFEILRQKKNLRLIKISELKKIQENAIEIRNSSFGYLLQERDSQLVTHKEIQIVSRKKPKEEEIQELLFADKIAKAIKSNAVVFTKDKLTLGIGAGQMSRLDSIQFAIEKAKNAKLSLKGSFLGSDAFFPFKDGIELAIKADIIGIIQPGGSIRDEESIQAANDANIIMAFTGRRHFRH